MRSSAIVWRDFDEDKLSLTAFLEDEPGDTFGLRLRVVNSSKTFLEMRCPVFSLFESKEYVKPVAHFGNEGFYVSLAPEEKLGITLKIGLTHKQMILEGYYRLTFELYNSIGERYVEQVRFVDSNTASRRQTEKSEADVIDTVAFGYKYFAYNYDEGRYDEL